MVSHESLHALLGATGRSAPFRRWLADHANARTARTYDTVVCATNWAGADFRRIGASNLAHVPLGVDLVTFHPRLRDDAVRRRFAGVAVPGNGLAFAALAGPSDAVEFHNLAEPGALSLTLADRQLPAALGLRPTIAAIVVGANDTLRGTFDIARTGRALDQAIGTPASIRRGGAHRPAARSGTAAAPAGGVCPTAGAPDPRGQRGARRPRRPPRHVAPQRDRAAGDLRPFHVERRSVPSQRAWHRLFANAFADLLEHRGQALRARPALEPTNPPPTGGASARWLATRGVKWVYDRATDLVPSLAAMALTEWWSGVTGAVDGFEAAAQRDVARALDELHRQDSNGSLPSGVRAGVG